MKLGTKSLLFGAHCFFLHPFFVAWAWWKLYGFPWDPRLWVAFIVHDWGYWGLEAMDDERGEMHPWVGARIMTLLFDSRHPVQDWRNKSLGAWGLFALRHSRFLAKRLGLPPSRLCMADKLAITLTPWWLYVPMTLATGEIHEYRRHGQGGKTDNTDHSQPSDSHKTWYQGLQAEMRAYVEMHKDGREDTWTPARETGAA